MKKSQALTGVVIVVVTAPMLHALFQSPLNSIQVEPPAVEYDPLVSRPNEEGDAGEISYRRYCAGCHGVNGDGQGPAAPLLDPKPRDFTKGLFKFQSTESGTPPLDDDILRSITRGLHGTSMPAWRLLPDHERRALVRTVKSFHDGWSERGVPIRIPFHRNPYDMEWADEIEEAIEAGKIVYHQTGRCWSCHPGYMDEGEVEKLIGVPPGSEYAASIAKPDVWGASILPPDFRVDRLKSIDTLEDLYRVITAGVGGTAMPSWTALPAQDLWSLTIYVDSLRPRSLVRTRIRQLREKEESN